MSQGIESDKSACGALGVVTEALAAQASALNRLFFRAAAAAMSADPRSHHHARKPLKAQARCRATVKVLMALRAAAGATQKFSNSNEGTIQTPKTTSVANNLARREEEAVGVTDAPRPKPLSRRRVRRSPTGEGGWSPERRARQAAAIRTWQPWRTSTGPQTQAGKVRSAGNALKHGRRSKAHVELRREDRQILACAASNIAMAKTLLRSQLHGRAVATGIGSRERESVLPGEPPSHSIDIGPVAAALIPSRLAIIRDSRPRRHLPPAEKAGRRRRWRIAS